MRKTNHVSYRGKFIDMASMRRENESTPAVGNMNTNARGDLLNKNGNIVKSADQVAKDKHRIRTAVTQTGLKGPQPESVTLDDKIKGHPKTTEKKIKNVKEVEADNRDIIINNDGDQS